jgi:ribosomal protein S21
MAVEVQKKENESSASLIRRFSHKLQQSGNLMRVRLLHFKKRPESNLNKKKKALWRIAKKKEMERLYKLGKIELKSR